MILEWQLPDDLSAAGLARQHVADDLRRRDVPEAIADDVVLITSELAANAVRHGRPPVRLRLEYGADSVRIVVSNHAQATDPRVIEASEGSHHGRGLAMVQALASDLGWNREGERLEVWADVALDEPAVH